MSKHHCQVSFLFESLSLSLSLTVSGLKYTSTINGLNVSLKIIIILLSGWGRHESVDSETHSETRTNRKDDIVQVWKQKGKQHQELLKSDTTNNPMKKIRRTTEVNYCWVHPSLSNVVCVFNFKYGFPSPQNLKFQPFNRSEGRGLLTTGGDH